MEEPYNTLLLAKHPLLRPKQDKSVLEDNLEIMAKSMTPEQINDIKDIELRLGSPGLLSSSIEKERNKRNPNIYEKEIKPIWDLMVFGLMCDKGWFNLIDAAMDLIEEENKKEKINIEEIKEKYGELRIYFSGGSDKLNEKINRISILSNVICEECGEVIKTKHKQGSWIYTRCDKHFANPREENIPFSENAVTKQQILDIIKDENWLTPISEIEKEYDKKIIINARGKIIQNGKKTYLVDENNSNIRVEIKSDFEKNKVANFYAILKDKNGILSPLIMNYS
ncbi:MAG: hypothetical protein QXL51_08225 [Candidatus Aenigmatarchaeota archaeon]